MGELVAALSAETAGPSLRPVRIDDITYRDVYTTRIDEVGRPRNCESPSQCQN